MPQMNTGERIESPAEDIQQARRQLEVILNGVADGIVGYDREGRLVYANNSAARLLGYPSVQALLSAPVEETRDQFEILDEAGRPVSTAWLPHMRVLRGEPAAEEVVRYRVRTTGEEKWALTRAAPVWDSNGQIELIIDIFEDITEAHQAEIEHVRLATIVQSSDDAIIGKSLDGIITSWNPGAERMFGYEAAEAVGRSITMIFPPDRQDESWDILERLRRGERIEHYETERVRKDGSRLDASVSVSPLRDRHGHIIGAADITRDISQTRQAEIEHIRLATIVQSSDDAIIGKNLDGVITSWNPGAERMFGYSSAEVIGRSIRIIFPPDRQDESRDILERLRRGERIEHYETERVRKDGSRLDVSVSVSPLRDSHGRIVGAADITRNISERRRRERADRFLDEASNALASSLDYETTLQAVVQLVVPALADWCALDLLDSDGVLRRLAIVHADPAKVELAWEYSRRRPPDPQGRYGVARVVRTGQSELVPEIPRGPRPDAINDPAMLEIIEALGFHSVMIVPLKARGRVLGSLTCVTAESRRRFGPADLALAEELGRRAAIAIDNAVLYGEAQRAVRLRDQFMSIASHELRTPLTSVLGFTQVLSRRLERRGILTDPDRRALEILRRQGEQLNRLIGGLLDFSRIQSGRLELQCAPLDLGALVRQIVDEEAPDDRNYLVKCRTPNEPLVINGDAVRLEQAIQNLLQNAIKYSPKDSPIEVQVERQADAAVVAVSDQGIGIPAEAQPHIFERFYRADNVDPSHISGMGIGLFVVREIVSLHDGTVEVASQEGQGSTFTIRLPLAPLATQDELPSPEVQAASQAELRGNGT